MAERHCAELRSQGYTILRDAMSAQQLSAVREAFQLHNPDGETRDSIIVNQNSTECGELSLTRLSCSLFSRNICTCANCSPAHVESTVVLHGCDVAGENPGELLSGACLVCKHSVFREVAMQPTVLAIVEALLGEDCVLSSSNSAHREPGCPAQNLHRDTSIWGPSMPLLSEPVGIQTAWCVDEFSEKSGGTRLVPGSHHADTTVTGAIGPGKGAPNTAIPSEEAAAITVAAPAGSIIMFDARILHAGGANTGTHHRRACLTLFVRHWLKPQHDLKRSIDSSQLEQVLEEPDSNTMLRLLGFHRQSTIEMADGSSAMVGTARLAVGGFYGGSLADGDTTVRLPPRAGQPSSASKL